MSDPTRPDPASMRRYADHLPRSLPSAAALLRDGAAEIERQAALLDRCKLLAAKWRLSRGASPNYRSFARQLREALETP